MKLQERIDAFVELGRALHSIEEADRNVLYRRATDHNAWFTARQCELAVNGILKFLVKEKLEQWVGNLVMADNLSTVSPRKVGVVMAGNIPMVGFHDLLSVLISGHHLVAKLSSQDKILMQFVIEQLVKIEPAFGENITLAERMNDVDAIIATGSDNTGRYFEYYFRNIPHIIRKNRSSVGVIQGNETDEELFLLGKDVFSYYGLGCRNVSKLFVPGGYDFRRMLDLWEPYNDVLNHHKYANNYDHNKSILLVNGTPHLDNGFLLITKSEALVSPISVLYYDTWNGSVDLKNEKIQCVVSKLPNGIPFGKSQEPELWDYADGVDTLKFLTGLS